MPLRLVRPRPLRAGDRIAIVSPSWGGPGQFPARYELGLRQLRDLFRLDPVDMPHTRADPDWIWRHPEARAGDINAAWADPTIRGVMASIGGQDSVRILPYLDADSFRRDPKPIVGFSDITTLHVFALLHGVSSFYGPSVMAGIAEAGGTLRYTEHWFRRALMSDEPLGLLEPAPEWTEQTIPWSDASRRDERRVLRPNPGWTWAGGETRAEGHLVGGCLDVLEFLKGTPWWPGPKVWDDAIFYWETSEDAPSPLLVGYWLRNYGMQGILGRIRGMIVGRPRDYTNEQHDQLRAVVRDVVAVEFGRPEMPVVLDVDFGHTDPMLTIPNGATATIDPRARTITVT